MTRSSIFALNFTSALGPSCFCNGKLDRSVRALVATFPPAKASFCQRKCPFQRGSSFGVGCLYIASSFHCEFQMWTYTRCANGNFISCKCLDLRIQRNIFCEINNISEFFESMNLFSSISITCKCVGSWFCASLKALLAKSVLAWVKYKMPKFVHATALGPMLMERIKACWAKNRGYV